MKSRLSMIGFAHGRHLLAEVPGQEPQLAPRLGVEPVDLDARHLAAAQHLVRREQRDEGLARAGDADEADDQRLVVQDQLAGARLLRVARAEALAALRVHAPEEARSIVVLVDAPCALAVAAHVQLAALVRDELRHVGQLAERVDRQPLLVVQGREEARLLRRHVDAHAPRVELLERRHRAVAPIVLRGHGARAGLAPHGGVPRDQDHLLVGVALLVVVGEQDDRVVGVRRVEPRPRARQVEGAAVELEQPAVERNARADLLRRRGALQSRRGTARCCARCSRRRSPTCACGRAPAARGTARGRCC